MDDNDGATFILDCMEAQVDDDTKLMKELELLTACTLNEEPNEMLTPVVNNDMEINLAIPDPKSQPELPSPVVSVFDTRVKLGQCHQKARRRK